MNKLAALLPAILATYNQHQKIKKRCICIININNMMRIFMSELMSLFNKNKSNIF